MPKSPVGHARSSRILRTCLGAAVVAIAALLSVPGTSFAKNDRADTAAASATVLRSGGTMVRGEGFGAQHGSRAVRALQLHLRARGFAPGPIDGLFGPRTQAAVERFQKKHGLEVDGVVGPQTRKPLVVQAAARRDRTGESRPAEAKPTPPEPARGKDAARAERAPKNAPIAVDVPPAPVPPSELRVTPASTSGFSPWIAAAIGALGAALVLGALRLQASRRRGSPKRGAHEAAPRPSERRPSLGMVCAALLAVFAVGAAVGALFATRASDEGRPSADAPRAALLPVQSSGEGGAGVRDSRRPIRLRADGSLTDRVGQP